MTINAHTYSNCKFSHSLGPPLKRGTTCAAEATLFSHSASRVYSIQPAPLEPVHSGAKWVPPSAEPALHFFRLLLHLLGRECRQSREPVLHPSAPPVNRTARFRCRELHR